MADKLLGNDGLQKAANDLQVLRGQASMEEREIHKANQAATRGKEPYTGLKVMQRLTKDRAHVRVNRSGRLRDHVRNMNPQPGDQLLVGWAVPCHLGTILRHSGWRVRCDVQKNGLGSVQTVKRDDGKMVPVTLVKFL